MSTNLEIEFKNMLSESEYQQLLNQFSIDEEQIWTQKNVYFDTKAFDLKRQKLRFVFVLKIIHMN